MHERNNPIVKDDSFHQLTRNEWWTKPKDENCNPLSEQSNKLKTILSNKNSQKKIIFRDNR